MLVLQWNARSLRANGQEFKGFLQGLVVAPEVICVVETWWRVGDFELQIEGYDCVRRDREGTTGGGCATYVRRSGVSYRVLEVGVALEVVVVEVWIGGVSVCVVNFYHPGRKRLVLEELVAIKGVESRRVLWCGDFNAHGRVWGGSRTDADGLVVEGLMDTLGLVCLND